MSIDLRRFEQAKMRVLTNQYDPHGFGTLQEKTVHAVMKTYYAPDENFHEIPLEGFVADIFHAEDQSIIEIQNGNFYRLREKLNAFLPKYDVTVVYPIPGHRILFWVDPESGEVKQGGKSRNKFDFYQTIPELYAIRTYIADPHFHLRIPILSMNEYRLLNGWSKDKKRGSNRYDRVPVEFMDELVFDRIEDFMAYIPITLEEEFTSEEFAKEAKIKRADAQFCLKFFLEIGILERIGKRSRSYLYRIRETFE